MVRQATNAPQRPKRGAVSGGCRLMAALIACCCAYDCDAIDRITVEIGQISTASVQASGATMTLDVSPGPDPTSPAVRAEIAKLHIVTRDSASAALGTTYSDVEVSCRELVVRKPEF